MAIFKNAPPIVTNGLVLNLDAKNPKSYPGADATWYDLSGNNNSGSLINGVGYSNGAMNFDGTNDYIMASDSPSLNITSGLTISHWFRCNRLANNAHGMCLISKGRSTDNNSGNYETLVVQINSKNYSYFRFRANDSTTPVYLPTLTELILGNVYNMICTYDGQIMRTFINGVEEGTGLAKVGTIRTDGSYANFHVGLRTTSLFSGSDSWFYGNIFSVMIYNRALSVSEIQQNYNALKGRYNL